MEIRAARAEKFTIQARGAPGVPPRKIAKLVFGRKDGSLYLSFPYFEHSEGIVSLMTLTAGLRYPTDLSLTDRGKVTSHLVKYAHHRDGQTHFSQAGKVRTEIRKQAVPLNQYAGHLFTIQVQDLSGFEEATGPDYDLENDQDQPMTLDVLGREPRAVKIVGFWYGKRELRRRVSGIPHVGPGIELLRGHERLGRGAILSAPVGSPGSAWFLVLRGTSVPPLTKEPGSHLTFAGGFDHPDVVNDQTRPTSFLALSYPAGDFDTLKSQIGSIDLMERYGDGD